MKILLKKSVLSLALVAGLSPACSQKSFTANDGDGAKLIDGNGNLVCRDQLVQQTVPVKVILAVDASGSNVDQGRYYGSDPNKSARGGSIQTFFNTYSSKSNFSWNFIAFMGASATSLIGNSSVNPYFSTNPGEMQQAINRFYGLADSGDTPYAAALDMVRSAIAGDASYTTDSKYIVVFISDGVPDPAISDSALISRVKGVLNTRPGQVTLSTIYYGSYNQEASSRLEMMADYGNGGFLDANSSYGNTFQIESAIQVPGTLCP